MVSYFVKKFVSFWENLDWFLINTILFLLSFPTLYFIGIWLCNKYCG